MIHHYIIYIYKDKENLCSKIVSKKFQDNFNKTSVHC